MPSQEEYLDNLLKDIMNENEAEETMPEPSGDLSDVDMSAEHFDVQDTAAMGSEDIEQLLAQRQAEAMEPVIEENSEPVDLLELLEEAEGAGIKDIQEMLQKSDNNEPVADDIISLLENAQNQQAEIQWEDIDEEAPIVERPAETLREKLEEKRRRRQEAKKQAKAEREEKKARAKAEKEARNKARKKQAGKQTKDEKPEEDTRDLEAEMRELFGALDQGEGEGEAGTEDLLGGIGEVGTEDLLGGIGEAGTEDLFGASGEASVENLLAGVDDLPDLDDLGERPQSIEDAVNKKKEIGKKGLFAKLLDFLTEEDEPESETSALILSDENDAILKELDKEGEKKKKGKKGKKDKQGKNAAGAEGGEGDEEVKVKKPKKPKKEKKPKKVEPEVPGKKLSKRRVFLIFLVCLTIGAIIILLSNVTVDVADKKKAAAAYYEGDYEACYQNLVGKDLNESQQVMFGKSESILRIRLWMREYEMFEQEGAEPEALDSLMQSVHDYPQLYSFSNQWNATFEVQEIYGQMLDILRDKYGLSEDQAKKIANEPDDVEYSRMVRAIAGGAAFGDWTEPVDRTQDENADLLPEETELQNTEFID